MKKVICQEEFLKHSDLKDYEDYKFMILQTVMYDIWTLKKITKALLVISIVNLLLMLIHTILWLL